VRWARDLEEQWHDTSCLLRYYDNARDTTNLLSLTDRVVCAWVLIPNGIVTDIIEIA
jgi:hypothetical protein